jgi:ATP-dependent exoDNAse (exonuclease V) alpha subunit
MILVAKRIEAAQLNHACQARRQAAGLVRPNGFGVKTREGSYRICQGDQVLFTKKSRKYGLENGDLGLVTEVSRLTRTFCVQLASGKVLRLPQQDSARIQVELGYAATTHKLQGATVKNSYVLLGGSMQDLHLTYVQATRTKEHTRFYVDRFEAGDKLATIAAQAARRREQKMASELLEISREKPTDRAKPSRARSMAQLQRAPLRREQHVLEHQR